MRTITEGHKYELDHFENYGLVGCPVQTIQFIEKTMRLEGNPDRTELVTVNDGTTNEEVLAMLIERMNYLQAKFPCRENAIVITKLEESLMWIHKRTGDRLARGVEGTNNQ